MEHQIDVLAVGELLVDMISESFEETLTQADRFRRLQGGSPANVAQNLARLGNRVYLAASVGQDAMGTFLEECMVRAGVHTDLLRRVAEPSTLILITRSREVSAFEAYRGADKEIEATQLPAAFLSKTRIFHTTCFAWSSEPARSSIFAAAKQACELGVQLSLDANYAEKIWPNRQEAQECVSSWAALGSLIKISEVDWARLYDEPLEEPQKALDHFLQLGARAVCVTLGAEGCWVANHTERHFLPAREVQVVDTTGAGDAFWSGFLHAWLRGAGILQCGKAARRMAELKLQHFGPLEGAIQQQEFLSDLPEWSDQQQ